MTGENECGCRLPCGVCMVTNRKCPISVPTPTPTYTIEEIEAKMKPFLEGEDTK